MNRVCGIYFFHHMWNVAAVRFVGVATMHASLLVTFGAILSWAALSAASRILLLRLGLDPWAFSFIQLCAGGIFLLAVSGRHMVGLSSFKRPATWILGVLRVFSAAFYTAVLAQVSVLEAGILGSINVPMIAIAVWLIFRRRPARGEWLGHLVILGSLPLLLMKLGGSIGHQAVGLMLLNAICLVAIAILAERHPDNVSDQPGVRLQFTGAVLLVTAALFLVARLAQGGTSDGILDWPLLVTGILVGVLLRAPSMVLSFWSIRLVGAQNYMAAVSFLPLFGMAFEQVAFAIGLIDVSRFHLETLLIAVGVVVGTLLVIAARRRVSNLTAATLPRQM